MSLFVDLNVNHNKPFAVELRKRIASLEGAATAFFLDGVGYTVIRPGVVQALLSPAFSSLPKQYSGLVVQVRITAVSTTTRNIEGNFRNGKSISTVTRQSTRPNTYNIETRAPSLREAQNFHAKVMAGDAGRHRVHRG